MQQAPLISSPQNPRFKQCMRLRQNRQRRKTAQFLIDGGDEIQRALEAGIGIEAILYADGQTLSPTLTGLVSPFEPVLQPVSEALLQKLTYGQTAAQPVAVAQTPDLSLNRISLKSTDLVLVLDQTEKPGNLGACLRTAAACGVDAVVLTNPICDQFNPNAIRASRGSMFRVPLAVATASEFQARAAQMGMAVYCARVDGRASLWDLPLAQGGAFVFGSEAHGLGTDWPAASAGSFSIAMSSAADSLNLSISAAVTLYEAVRQRRIG